MQFDNESRASRSIRNVVSSINHARKLFIITIYKELTYQAIRARLISIDFPDSMLSSH